MNKYKKLGVNNGQLAAMPKSPNAVSSQATDKRMQVNALPMSGSVAETRDKIISCLKQMGGNAVESQSDDYIHAIFTTPLLRFKDDIEFYIDEANSDVHFRSASRVGYSDMGANRKRYEAFKALYQ